MTERNNETKKDGYAYSSSFKLRLHNFQMNVNKNGQTKIYKKGMKELKRKMEREKFWMIKSYGFCSSLFPPLASQIGGRGGGA